MNQREFQATVDDMFTTTWYDVRSNIVDQVFESHPLYDRLVEQGKIKAKKPDGIHFEYPLRYGKQDQNTKFFGKGTKFDRAEQEALTRWLYRTKNLGTSVVRFWEEEQKNRGTAKIIDYVEEKVENTRNSLQDTLADAIMVQSTDPLAITALPTLISTTPTVGTIGGFDRSTTEWARNQVVDFDGLTTQANLIDSMTEAYNKASIYRFGQRTPDLIMTTREIYQDYEAIARAMQTIVTNKSERASLGFGDIMFKNTEVFWDQDCPAGQMFFMNTDTLEMPYDPGNWFEMTEWKGEIDSLDRAAQIVCVCNLVCTMPKKNVVIHNITANSN